MIRQLSNKAGVRPICTTGQVLPSPSDPCKDEEKTCLIYFIPCSVNMFSISKTNDPKSCLADHKRAIRCQRPEQSGLCEHAMQLDHFIY